MLSGVSGELCFVCGLVSLRQLIGWLVGCGWRATSSKSEKRRGFLAEIVILFSFWSILRVKIVPVKAVGFKDHKTYGGTQNISR
jgi:hypothetical protein